MRRRLLGQRSRRQASSRSTSSGRLRSNAPSGSSTSAEPLAAHLPPRGACHPYPRRDPTHALLQSLREWIDRGVGRSRRLAQAGGQGRSTTSTTYSPGCGAYDLTPRQREAETAGSGAVALQSHVSRLRRHLGPASPRLENGLGGYRLRLDPGELDVPWSCSGRWLLADCHRLSRWTAQTGFQPGFPELFVHWYILPSGILRLAPCEYFLPS